MILGQGCDNLSHCSNDFLVESIKKRSLESSEITSLGRPTEIVVPDDTSRLM
jgi:hypothetical protein